MGKLGLCARQLLGIDTRKPLPGAETEGCIET